MSELVLGQAPAAAAAASAGEAKTARDEAVAARNQAQATVGAVKATVADTTPTVLNTKLATGVSLLKTVLNPGANEQLRLDVNIPGTGVTADRAVTVADRGKFLSVFGSAVPVTLTLDPLATVGTGFYFVLKNSLPASVPCTIAATTPDLINGQPSLVVGPQQGGHIIAIGGAWGAVGISGNAYDVRTSVADATPGTLNAKLAVGPGLMKTIVNPGANEQIQLDANFPSAGATSDRTITAADRGRVVSVFGTAPSVTLTLDLAATLGLGFFCFVKNILPPSSTLMIVASGSDKIDTVASIPIAPGDGVMVVVTGATGIATIGRAGSRTISTALPSGGADGDLWYQV